ncbi:asparaginase domain-containing protein [Nocardia brasiliensis]|uniref:asparaginase domain-containing protein n=1 Tax=Nocardia brasiliensis TaxID=37326 RepID=UPI00245711BA|nr:asparaginase domain-containing protein [Nocardia brasiliensis]
MSSDPVRVGILYTGGTFGMVDSGAGMRPRAGLAAEISEMVAEFESAAGVSVDVRYHEFDQIIDSARAEAGTARRIAASVRAGIASAAPDGVIVIHGTDTMAYIGARMAFELRDSATPVVLTGAQIPLGQPGSDARSNLHLALATIVGQPAPATYLAFGSKLHPAVRASKRAIEDYDGFTTIRDCTPPPVPPALPIRQGAGAPVGLLTIFPGMHAELLDAALRYYRGGLVLECYGAGTAPDLAGSVRVATGRGTPVVVISQCDSGSVDLDRYQPGRALLDAGALSGGDMTREAALAKLSYLVDHGFGGAELRHWMVTNLLGELANIPAAPAVSSRAADNDSNSWSYR